MDGSTIADWLVTDGARLEMGPLIEGLGVRLIAAGVPLERFSMSFGLLNPSVLAAGVRWRPGRPTEWLSYNYSERDLGLYDRSPLKMAHDEKRWVDLFIPDTPDELFGIVPDLRADGLVHYIAMPIPGSRDGVMSCTVATRDPNGFTDDHRAVLRKMLPPLGLVSEIKALNSTLHGVLSAYVGNAPAREILKGTVHRGEIKSIRAAMLIADLRGFTNISTKFAPRETAEIINQYYDAVVPPIVERGGEVLKFIGDAVLAIFPVEPGDEDRAAVLSALGAARAALKANCCTYAAVDSTVPIQFGIAVHVGDAVLGNVGSGDRLDFTVIGRDVNVAARLASLCSTLSRDFLVSAEVAAVGVEAGDLMAPAGVHAVRGIAEPLAVFIPDAEPGSIGPHSHDGVSHGLTLVD